MQSDIIRNKIAKASPFFLYLFIPNRSVRFLSVNIVKKRNKAIEIARWCAKKLKFTMPELMDILYDDIYSMYLKAPQEVIIDMIEGNADYISGDGESMSKIVAAINWIISKLKGLFGKAEKISASIKDSPAYDDFKAISKSVSNKVFSKKSSSSEKKQSDKYLNLTQTKQQNYDIEDFDYNPQPVYKKESVKTNKQQVIKQQRELKKMNTAPKANKASMGGILLLSLLLGGLFLGGRKK